MSEESIYNLIPQQVTQLQKGTMHKSKFPGNIPPTFSTFGAGRVSQINVANIAGAYAEQPRNHEHISLGATFGKTKEHDPQPKSFLTRQLRPELPEPAKFEYKMKTKAPLDHKSTFKPAQTSKNFISENALKAIMAESKTAPRDDQDYVTKPDYGRVPAYLGRVKEEIQKEKDYVYEIMKREKEEEIKQQPRLRLLPEEERLALVNDLKLKWEAVNKKYQLMTHNNVLDTNGKIRRKETNESELSNLEKAIERLSKKNVYIQEEDF